MENSISRLVVIMGFAGCGKSAFGGTLATRLGKPFIDADDYHTPENVEKMSKGIPLTDEDRWPWLDSLGKFLPDEAESSGMAVMACSVLRRVYRKRLSISAGEPVFFAFLDGLPELIAERIGARTCLRKTSG